jgi:hypothetical protein
MVRVILIVGNRDPSISQLSLSGAWVMSQFKILIDEREEAKRDFEQLKAEFGSLNSGSSNAQQKPPATNVAETSEIQFASSPVHEVELAAYNDQNLPSYLPDKILPADSTSKTKADKPNPKPASINSYTSEPQDSSAKRILIDMLRCVVLLLCCPCYYFFGRTKPSGPISTAYPSQTQYLAQGDRPAAPYPYGPVVTTYENLEAYGPEGVFELAVPTSGGPAWMAPLRLPAPVALSSFGFEASLD